MKDIYQWRITNFSQQTGVGAGAVGHNWLRLDSVNNEFTFQTPSHLRNKGKCYIRVVGGTIGISHMGTANSAATRIVPDETRLIY